MLEMWLTPLLSWFGISFTTFLLILIIIILIFKD